MSKAPPAAAPAVPAKKGGEKDKEVQLPLARVHRIIQADRDVRMCTKEAIFLIARATEFMINKMINQAYDNTRITSKGKQIKYQDLAHVTAKPEWFYLGEVIPPTVTLRSALEYRAEHGVGGVIETSDEAHPSHPSTSGVLGVLGDAQPMKKAARKTKAAPAALAPPGPVATTVEKPVVPQQPPPPPPPAASSQQQQMEVDG